MLFNPIFINPQKFLSTPETSGVKQNKLSYLFSDIIKNSLGVKIQTNESELGRVEKSNTTGNPVAEESLKVNSSVELTDAEKSIIGELNTILANFDNSKVNKDNKTETIKIEKADHEEIEITGDDGSVTQMLNGLINLVEKYNLQIVTSEKELPKNVIKEYIGADYKNMLSDLKKIINHLEPDKQLQITVKVGGKNIDLSLTKAKLNIVSANLEKDLQKQELKNPQVKLNPTVNASEDVNADTNRAKSPTNLSQPNSNSTIKSKNDLANSIKKATQPELIVSDKKTEVNLKSKEFIRAQNKAANVVENEKPVNTISPKFYLAIKISEAESIIPEKVLQSSADSGIEKQNKLVDASKISFKIAKAPILKLSTKGSDEVKASPEIKIANTETNTTSNKLIQSIKKIDNNMLKQDIVPRQIKFNPVAVDEIKNQKFQLLNLSSAVRTIKSLSKPIDEKFVSNTFKLNANNSFEKNDVRVNVRAPKATTNFQQEIKFEEKIDSEKEVLPKPKNDVKLKTESELKLSSKEILTAIRSSSKTVEIKKLQEFLSIYKNEKLSIKVVSKEHEVKLSNENIVKPSISKTLTERETAKPIQQKEFTGKQFEIDFEKFEKAVKEKGGSKSIREFISSNDRSEKSKIVIEPVKANAAEKVSVKITEATKVISEASTKAVQNNMPGKEEILSKEAPKVNEFRSSETQKEVKIETNPSAENKTTSSNNSSSNSNQSEQNNFAKTTSVEIDKYPTVNNNDNFLEELKNVNIVKPAETAPTGQSSELNVNAKEMPEIFRDVKAADIYKELYKIIEKKEHQSITFQVIPKKLGRVKVVVDIVDQMVQTKIEVENESAKQLLQNNMDALKQSLNQSGIQLSNYSVSLSSSNNKTYKPFNSKKKDTGNGEPENTDNENIPISGKKMGYNTYEYLI
jgi:flagellar hook-length control protein FliK